jgi:hypothetical protein
MFYSEERLVLIDTDCEDYEQARDYEHDYIWRHWARVRCIHRSACHIDIYGSPSYRSIANEM